MNIILKMRLKGWVFSWRLNDANDSANDIAHMVS